MPKVNFKKGFKNIEKDVKEELKEMFKPGENVGIKLHMGEPGNQNFMRPEFVKRFVDVLLELGTTPFLFDSPVTYNSPRNTPEGYLKAARKNGFTESRMGCQIMISNDSTEIKVRGRAYYVCKNLIEADGVLALTHIKGHMCCGFGGAIKNLGMGGQSKETKGKIHKGGEPEYTGGCTLCMECSKKCPTGNITYESDKPRFDKTWCCGCSNCVLACRFNAIKAKQLVFDKGLAEAAYAAVKNYKKSYFINLLKNISSSCDCNASAGPPIMEDLGMLFTDDLIAADKAAVDIINKKQGKDLFEEINRKSPLIHIKELAELMGVEQEYELIS